MKVSLLIPTHNNVTTVVDAIESCMAQTYKDLEILVYDEASTDGTLEVINNCAKKDSRIRVMSNTKNSGPVRAWGKLLQECQGEYATFVWSDDRLCPTYVETLLTYFKKHPFDLLVTCNALYAQPLTFMKHQFDSARISSDVYALAIFSSMLPVSQMCSLFRVDMAREVFVDYVNIENPYAFDYSVDAYGNDVGFLCELAFRSGFVGVVGEPLTVLRGSPDNMTNRLRNKNLWRYLLQYTYAFYYSWQRNRSFVLNAKRLCQAGMDRLCLCDMLYSVRSFKWPRYFNVWRSLRALWYIIFIDRHGNKETEFRDLEVWLNKGGLYGEYYDEQETNRSGISRYCSDGL